MALAIALLMLSVFCCAYVLSFATRVFGGGDGGGVATVSASHVDRFVGKREGDAEEVVVQRLVGAGQREQTDAAGRPRARHQLLHRLQVGRNRARARRNNSEANRRRRNRQANKLGNNRGAANGRSFWAMRKDWERAVARMH